MLSTKEILERQREAKKAKQKVKEQKLMAKDTRINPREWRTSSYNLFLVKVYNAIKNNQVAYKHLIDDFPQFHRMTFWNCDYDLRPARVIIEKVMNKYLSDYTPDSFPEEKLKDKVAIHYKQREILLRYIEVISSVIQSYTLRYEFASDNKEMVLNHQIYTKMSQPVINKWSDWQAVKEAYEIIDNRITAYNRFARH